MDRAFWRDAAGLAAVEYLALAALLGALLLSALLGLFSNAADSGHFAVERTDGLAFPP